MLPTIVGQIIRTYLETMSSPPHICEYRHRCCYSEQYPSLPYVSNFSVSRLQFHPDCISLEFLKMRIFYNCIYILGPLPMIALLGKNLPPKIVFACLTRLWLVKLPIQNYWCWKAQLYGKTSMKKTFSLEHCSIHLASPPP